MYEFLFSGTACLPDYKLNNFAAIYLSRMALVLTQPNHIMYLPLSHHLLAKASLDFSTIPELYTFLHSSDVNFKEHRNFILEILRDGLRTEKDFMDFLRSMAFKLFSEFYSSSISDTDTKLLVLEVLKALSQIPLGVKMLTENHSLLSQIISDVGYIIQCYSKDKYNPSFIDSVISIILGIVKIINDKNVYFLTLFVLKGIITNQFFNSLVKNSKKILFHSLFLVFDKYPSLFSPSLIEILLQKADDAFSSYMYKYGNQFVGMESTNITNENYYLRLLVKEYINKKKER